jgi:hypothetical protein
MKRQTPDPIDDRQLELPQALKDDLMHLYGAGVPVPPARNEAILEMGRCQMSRRRRMRLILRRSFAAAAVAAVVALAVLLVRPDPRSKISHAPMHVAQNKPKAEAPNEAKPSSSEISNLESEIRSPAPGPKSPTPRGIAALNEPKATTRAASMPLDPKDIDHNGRVDILDAFLLARQIKAGGQLGGDRLVLPGVAPKAGSPKTDLSRFSGPVSPAWDFNGDGVIDQKDVDAVAMSAVKLKGGAL